MLGVVCKECKYFFPVLLTNFWCWQNWIILSIILFHLLMREARVYIIFMAFGWRSYLVHLASILCHGFSCDSCAPKSFFFRLLTRGSLFGTCPPLQYGCEGARPLNLAWLSGDHHLGTLGFLCSLKGRHGVQFWVWKSARVVAISCAPGTLTACGLHTTV